MQRLFLEHINDEELNRAGLTFTRCLGLIIRLPPDEPYMAGKHLFARPAAVCQRREFGKKY